jgi:hypothetical protein
MDIIQYSDCWELWEGVYSRSSKPNFPVITLVLEQRNSKAMWTIASISPRTVKIKSDCCDWLSGNALNHNYLKKIRKIGEFSFK